MYILYFIVFNFSLNEYLYIIKYNGVIMNKIKIRKIHNLNGSKIDNINYIYVGRGSKYLVESVLHNSFKVRKHGSPTTRRVYSLERSLYLYRIWLNEAIKAKCEEYKELLRILELLKQHDVTLVCFCINSDDYEDDYKEIVCHAQYIRRALIYLKDKI